MKKKLILESGEIFHGEGFGAQLETEGEVVFNTGMTGYQELISDPSYSGQMGCMTYPLIGNYGINRDDYESIEPAIKGLIVKELCDFPSNFRHQISLDELFKKKKLSGISGDGSRAYLVSSACGRYKPDGYGDCKFAGNTEIQRGYRICWKPL